MILISTQNALNSLA